MNTIQGLDHLQYVHPALDTPASFAPSVPDLELKCSHLIFLIGTPSTYSLVAFRLKYPYRHRIKGWTGNTHHALR